MTLNTEVLPLIIELKPEAKIQAQKLAAEQTTPQIRKQVYLNTLAVYSVHSFLQWMEVETDLQEGDSGNPYLCGFLNAADLVIPNLGKIECRVVMPDDTEITLPPEVTENRIAYVAIRVQEQLNQVELLGFVRVTDVSESATTLGFEQLEPIENLVDYLFRLESGMEFLQEKSEVDERVRQRLETTPMSQIIAQLERIVRQEPEYEWRTQGGKIFLPDLVGAGERERELREVSEEEEIAAQDLAEDLLEKLAEIWGDED